MSAEASEPRVAMVTGGVTGIGAAITKRFLAEGWNVYAVQRAMGGDEELRDGTGSEAFAGKLAVGVHDLLKVPALDVVSACLAHFGRLDALVNNAAVTGAAAVSPLERLSDDQIDSIIDTNLKVPLRLARESAAHLSRADGVIINIGSVAAVQAQPNAAAYVASKTGLIGLTRALAFDLGPAGVRVVHIAPGDIATATSRSVDYLSERHASAWHKTPPMGRAGSAEEVADAVFWAASPQASYLTGTTVLLDGGLSTY